MRFAQSADPWGSVTTAHGVHSFASVGQSINVCAGKQKVADIMKSNSSLTMNRTANDNIAAAIQVLTFFLQDSSIFFSIRILTIII